MTVRMWLTRILGGAPYPQEIADRLDAAVGELNDAIEELRAASRWLERHGDDAAG